MNRTWKAAGVLLTSAALVAVGWGAPAQAADNGEIAFYIRSNQQLNLVGVMEAPAGGTVRTRQYVGGYPAFAPDSSRIAVVNSSGALITFLPAMNDVVYLPAGGYRHTGDVTVATGVSQDRITPAWSPDSKRLAYFTGNGTDLKTLVISDATAGAPQVAVTDLVGQLDGSISWSPNGSTLLYSSPDGIMWVPAEAGATPSRLEIPGPDDRRDYGPSWSPDGRRFAFVRDCNACSDPSKTGVWTAAVDGSDPQQVVSANVQSPPSWSPNGKMIAYVVVAGANNRLTVATTSGTGQTIIMSGAGFAAPSWGGRSVQPTPTPTPPIAPDLVTAPEVTGNPVYGKKLTVSRGTWRGNPTKYTFQWLRCEKNPRRPCVPISGATKATYTIEQADLGVPLQAKVTAANGVGKNNGWSQRTLVPMPPKGKSVTLNIKILVVGRNGKLTVPVELKGTQPILSATVSVEKYGENVKSMDDAKKSVKVPVELSAAGLKKLNNRPVVLWTFKIFVVSKVNGKIYSSEGTAEIKVTAKGS